jgi:hypothetical protein
MARVGNSGNACEMKAESLEDGRNYVSGPVQKVIVFRTEMPDTSRVHGKPYAEQARALRSTPSVPVALVSGIIHKSRIATVFPFFVLFLSS